MTLRMTPRKKWWWPEEFLLLTGCALVAVVAFSLSWRLGLLYVGLAFLAWEEL